MIIKFKIFENELNSEDYYFLDLNELWNIYEENFKKIYPTLNLRKKDDKSRCHYYRIDIFKMLLGKKVEITVYDVLIKYYLNNNKKYYIKSGYISDIWTRYTNSIVAEMVYY